MEASSVGGLARLDVAKMNSLHRRALFLVSLGEFIDGYDLLVMGGALLLLVPQFKLTPAQVGLLGSAAFLGAAVGLVVFGDMSDRVGRRAIFIFNLIAFVIFAILSAFITDITQLFIARFIVGIAVGADIPTSTAFLAEMSPSRMRGALLGALPNITWTVGAFTATILGFFLLGVGPDAWRWMFGLAAIPALIVLLGRQTLPESPRWLISRGRFDEARSVLERLGITNPDLSAYTAEKSRFSELFGPKLRSRTIWVSVIFGLNCLAGPISTIATPFILKYVGLVDTRSALLFSGVVWIFNFLGASSSFFLIDRLGRKKLSVLSMVPGGLLAVGIALFGVGNPKVMVPLFFLFGYFVWLGAPSLQWAWSSELFPTRVRGRSQGVCNAVCRIMIAANTFIIPVGLATVGFTPTILLLSIPLFLYALITWTIPFFETKGKSLEELAVGG
ncbi:MAG TPA: MFS transporter [Chloroflexota bacterium]|nr:MFS transporter [Chloroflexota bacterium]